MDHLEVLVSVEKLGKTFKSAKVLSGVSFNVHRGEIHGIVGPNSAGKSTLLKTVAGLYLPSEGRADVFGTPAGKLNDEHYNRIGYQPQESALIEYQPLTVDEHCALVAQYYSSWDWEFAHRLRDRFELEAGKAIRNLSPGEKQKLHFLFATAHRPEVLILDEPTAWLDPESRQAVIDVIIELMADSSRAVIISSNSLADLEKVIDHLVVLQHGTMRWCSGLDDLREGFLRARVSGSHDALSALDLPWLQPHRRNGTQIDGVIESSQLPRFQCACAEKGVALLTEPLSFDELYQLLQK